ncbi:glycosyltransferase [Psychrobacter celer]|uniref:glycosyltransferase n=1 Tax=Psychrobacter celer TaxID=306572 RepID=UPI003FD32C68
MLNILLAPDRLAHYRKAIFNKIADQYNLDVYAPVIKDLTNIEVASNENNSFNWIPTKSYFSTIFGKFFCYWHTDILIASLFKKYDVYIFWGDSWNISVWISSLICKASRKKVVFWTHGIYGNENRIKLAYRLLFYKIPDRILVYGNHAKNEMIKNGLEGRHIYVINNSLDVTHQNEVYNEVVSFSKDKKNSDKRLIFIGRIEKNKKLEVLIRSIYKINSKSLVNDKVNLLIVGDGTQKSYLENLCSELGISSDVTFYGACYDQSTLAALIIDSDICISPGNIGLTAMQSLIYGTPVITHNDATEQMPEYEAVIDGESGVLYDKGSEKSLIEAIEKCLYLIDKNIINEESCRNVIIEKYNPEFQVKIFNKMIESI